MSVQIKALNGQSPVTQSGEMPSLEILLVISLLVQAVRDLEERVAALEP